MSSKCFKCTFPCATCTISTIAFLSTLAVLVTFIVISGIQYDDARRDDKCVFNINFRNSNTSCEYNQDLIQNGTQITDLPQFQDSTISAKIGIFSGFASALLAFSVFLLENDYFIEGICGEGKKKKGLTLCEYVIVFVCTLLASSISISILIIPLLIDDNHTSNFVTTSITVALAIPLGSAFLAKVSGNYIRKITGTPDASSPSTDDNPKSTDNNPKSTDDNPKSTDDNPKSTDDSSKSPDDSSKSPKNSLNI